MWIELQTFVQRKILEEMWKEIQFSNLDDDDCDYDDNDDNDDDEYILKHYSRSKCGEADIYSWILPWAFQMEILIKIIMIMIMHDCGPDYSFALFVLIYSNLFVYS